MSVHLLDRDRLSTACGIKLIAFYPMSGKALPVDSDDKIDCTENNERVTCQRCIRPNSGTGA